VEVEVCVDGIEGVLAARTAGAQRVELCADLALGGTTPSAGLVQAACRAGIDVVVLVRPRAGDFLYTERELDVMRTDIAFAAEHGARGVALGVLTPDGAVDARACAALIAAAGPLEVCFHRAFDGTADPFAALEELVELGVTRVLTSGQASDVVSGLPRLRELVLAADGRLQVMPGGGVRAENIHAVVATSGARAVHFSAGGYEPSAMRFRNEQLSFNAGELPGDFEIHTTNAERIGAFIAALQADA